MYKSIFVKLCNFIIPLDKTRRVCYIFVGLLLSNTLRADWAQSSDNIARFQLKLPFFFRSVSAQVGSFAECSLRIPCIASNWQTFANLDRISHWIYQHHSTSIKICLSTQELQFDSSGKIILDYEIMIQREFSCVCTSHCLKPNWNVMRREKGIKKLKIFWLISYLGFYS